MPVTPRRCLEAGYSMLNPEIVQVYQVGNVSTFMAGSEFTSLHLVYTFPLRLFRDLVGLKFRDLV